MELMISNIPPLHTNTQKGYPAPHKPILLLSILDLIEAGKLRTNKIALTDELVETFHHTWNRYVGNNPLFKANIGQPYWHLRNEPFWKLIPFEGGDDFLESIKKTNPYSIKKLRTIIRYAELDPDFFSQIKDHQTRVELRIHLIETYITPLFKNR